ncbi:MAG: hypothetical protein FVQ85_20990 [Planctomycetes bacterium]|nr:hypothetical protein [Planctomycetota bacterium]
MGTKDKKKRSLSWRLCSFLFKICLLGILCLIGLVIIGVKVGSQEGQNLSTETNIHQPSRNTVNQEKEEVTTNQSVAKSKETAAQKKPPKPTTISIPRSGTFEKLQYEIKRVLGSSNRGIAKIYKIEETRRNVKIVFSIDDNLTNGWVKDGAKIDIIKILKAVQSSGYRYSEVAIFGTFSFSDVYGNSEESVAVKASYTPSTVNRINWENFLYNNVYKIADSVWIAPAFR